MCYSIKYDGFSEYYSCPVYNKQKQRVFARFEEENDLITYKGSNCSLEVKENNLLFNINGNKLTIEFANDIEIEPTYNGVKIECNSNTCSFNINTFGRFKLKSNGRNIAFYFNKEEPMFTISGMYSENNKGRAKTKLEYEEKLGKCFIKVYGKTNSNKIVFEINAYEPKLIFDTTVEEEHPDANNCLGGIAFLSETNPKERLYMRFDFTKITDMNEKRIEQVLLCVPVYSMNDNTMLNIQVVKEPWCSMGLNWVNKVQGGDVICTEKAENGSVKFDITKPFKAMLKMQTENNYGFIITNAERNVAVVSTADNYSRPQKLIIKLKEQISYGNNKN